MIRDVPYRITAVRKSRRFLWTEPEEAAEVRHASPDGDYRFAGASRRDAGLTDRLDAMATPGDRERLHAALEARWKRNTQRTGWLPLALRGGFFSTSITTPYAAPRPSRSVARRRSGK